MRRLAALLAVAGIVSFAGVAAAAPADLCAGTPCEEICFVWQLLVSRECPID